MPNFKWPDTVDDYIYSIAARRSDIDNRAKADIIQSWLENLNVGDSFYIIVYDGVGTFEQHAFSHNGDNFTNVFRVGGCNIVVYRKLGKYYDSGIKHLEDASDDINYFSTTRNNQIVETAENIKSDLGSSIGMVGCIRCTTPRQVAIRVVGTEPGRYRDVKIGYMKEWYTKHESSSWLDGRNNLFRDIGWLSADRCQIDGTLIIALA